MHSVASGKTTEKLFKYVKRTRHTKATSQHRPTLRSFRISEWFCITARNAITIFILLVLVSLGPRTTDLPFPHNTHLAAEHILEQYEFAGSRVEQAEKKRIFSSHNDSMSHNFHPSALRSAS